MNLGIYIDKISDYKQLEFSKQLIDYGIETNKINDASIFYNVIGQNPYKFSCGIFNSTDLWNFSGKLLVYSLECAIGAMNIINNIDIIYYYGLEKEKINVLQLMAINKEAEYICNSEENSKELYRLTNKNNRLVPSYKEFFNG